MVYPHLFHCNSSLHSLGYSISSWTKLQKVQGLSKNNEIILVLLIQTKSKGQEKKRFFTDYSSREIEPLIEIKPQTYKEYFLYELN